MGFRLTRDGSGFLSRVEALVSDWGLRRVAYWKIMSVLAVRFGVRVSYVFVGSGSNRMGSQPVLVPPRGYCVRVIDLSELQPYTDRVPDLSKEFLASAKARGDGCVATFYDGTVVGFSFQTLSRAPVTDQLDILVPKGFKYTYKTWISSDHRQRNLSQVQGSVRSHTNGPSTERGLWYVETHNYPSLLHGYRQPRDRPLKMGLIGWISVFGREIPFASRRAKWLGVELVRKEHNGDRQYL